jgi:hypothetical protein
MMTSADITVYEKNPGFPKGYYVPGSVAVRYLIQKHNSTLFEVRFWLRDHFVTYNKDYKALTDQYEINDDRGYDANNYNPMRYWYDQWEVMGFNPMDKDRFVSYQGVIYESDSLLSAWDPEETEEFLDYLIEEKKIPYVTNYHIRRNKIEEPAAVYFRKEDLLKAIEEHHNKYMDVLMTGSLP